ncbi:DNA mismatch repair protein MutL [bacterium HR21]|nr:DNA mismatch repair protein MutL [bacterium HR21]
MEERRIWILPEFLASQIAAGEVVQRPESVVKELVENALDAQAATVAVTVHGAGKRLVHVVDDGCGMSRADVELCIRRHATSKVRTLEDLHRICTLGFRGEALASIAAVSQLEIRTRRPEDAIGWRLLAEPETEPRIEPWAGDKGTQVLVRNLFYNVPARRKFLRSDLTEFRLIADTMTRFVLGHLGVRFLLSDERALLFDVPPGTLTERFAALFGEELAQRMLPVEAEYEGFRVWGLIGHPECARPSRTQQFWFVNRRWVYHKGLSHAVYTAYEQLLESGMYPVFVLHLEVDPERVDVNVHPQKHEVKFDDERQAFAAVLRAVSEALGRHHLAPTVALAQDPVVVERLGQGESLVVNRLTGEVLAPEQIPSRRWTGQGVGHRTPGTSPRESPLFSVGVPAVFTELEQPVRCWQLHNTYIFWETPEGVRIVDQHVAHERVLYERFRRQWDAGERLPQRLLLPLALRLEPSTYALLEEFAELLTRLGFELEWETGREVRLAAVPAALPAGQEERVVTELLAALHEYRQLPRRTSVEEHLLATLACKAAIKAGQPLSEHEIRQLLRELQQCTLPFVCPHGRPVVIELTREELDRLFERR